MRALISALTALLLAVRAHTQDSSNSNSSDSEPTVRTITVGKALHKFVPNEVTAKTGDIISFQFFPPNHSVVRAEFGQPCIPYEYTGENKVGFNSGFYPLDKILPNPPSWNLTINDTNPIFFYCAAPGSCNNWTMVGAINPNDTNPLSIQRANAGLARFALAPGEPFPSEGEASAAKGSESPAGDRTSSDTSKSTSMAAASDSQSNALSGGAIAGIVIAVIFVVGILAAMFFLLGRQKGMIQLLTRSRSKENFQVMSTQPGAPSVTHAGYFQPYPGGHPDAALADAGFVAAPPYKRVSPLPGHRDGDRRGPHEVPSPGGTTYPSPTTGNPFDNQGHPAFRHDDTLSPPLSPRHEHTRTLSSTVSNNFGLHRGNGSKSSAILGITDHGSTRSPPPSGMRSFGSQHSRRNEGGSGERGRGRDVSRDAHPDGGGREGGLGAREGRTSPDVSVMVPSPLPSPKPQSRDGPPQLRPLSWWGRRGQKGDSSRGGSSHGTTPNGNGGGGGGFGSSWGKIMIGLEKAYR